MKRLVEYDATSQYWGQWLKGFQWSAYGCGTHRYRLSRHDSVAKMKRFLDRLRKRAACEISAVAVLERRFSGLGLPAIPLHWHFVLASSHGPELPLHSMASVVWGEVCGECKIEAYDPRKSATFYLTKTVGDVGELLFWNMDQLTYHGPQDLVDAALQNPYVPNHLKYKTVGRFLAVRGGKHLRRS